ncbi:hypothetical protein [Microbacterium sp. NPDC096154]|uniref:hypothetical protein n=1 Tax=Microbacterium sp. NPDC096154 TaxID=3155549 RepID=UPI0033315901
MSAAAWITDRAAVVDEERVSDETLTDSGAWPGAAEVVERWLTTAIHRSAARGTDGTALESVRVSADLRGSDLASLEIDLRGLRLSRADVLGSAELPSRFAGGTDPGDTDDDDTDDDDMGEEGAAALRAGRTLVAPLTTHAEAPAVVARTPALARSLRITADPMQLAGVPVSASIGLRNLPFDWVVLETADGALHGNAEIDDRAAQGLQGDATVTLRPDDLLALTARLAEPLLADAGVRILRSRIQVTQPERDAVRVRVGAVLARGRLTASAWLDAEVRIGPGGSVTVQRMRTGSGNLLVRVALGLVRGRMRALEGRTFTPDDLGLEGLDVTDLRVFVDDAVTVAARFSDTRR